eukprot:CAMPEP_0114236958 /NCGR_PEP_ID=MMETSP0058-20121206/7130_1 /TAXON_ID=36894 /ORGANISM="Pyramimonas parkeae, CCMP726" /LENGTH=294 /DNA_ID=CAMNT_0001348959 /DNA_START=230 /DNA_END=1114 /DNA_ORIENTATION=+
MEDPVVSTAWLADNLEGVALADVRGRVDQVTVADGVEESIYLDLKDEYLESHIPGAVFVSWLTAGARVDPESGVPAQLYTDSDEFAVAVEGLGLGTDRTVVVYDSGDGLLAPRIWWALRRHGHTDVRVLDGGFKKWEAEGRPLSITEPCPMKVFAEFDSSGARDDLLATRQTMLAAVADPSNHVIIDARSQKQFTAEVRRAKHGGRVPHSISVPRNKLVLQDGCFPAIDKLKDTLQMAGVDLSGEKKIVAYCNGGVASCSALLALARLGIDDAANYDASWNEWGNRDDTPIEVP